MEAHALLDPLVDRRDMDPHQVRVLARTHWSSARGCFPSAAGLGGRFFVHGADISRTTPSGQEKNLTTT